jgi:hypothetical protein
MFYHAAGCTISEGAAGDDDGPSKPTKSAMPTEAATPSARARRIRRADGVRSRGPGAASKRDGSKKKLNKKPEQCPLPPI